MKQLAISAALKSLVLMPVLWMVGGERGVRLLLTSAAGGAALTVVEAAYATPVVAQVLTQVATPQMGPDSTAEVIDVTGRVVNGS